jgi:hypothetical protein
MKKSIIPWIRKNQHLCFKTMLLAGAMALMAGCAGTLPAGTTSANTALATERAAVATTCNTAGVLGHVLAAGHQSGFFTPANWLKIQDIYVAMHPTCHPVGGVPNLTNYASLSLTLAQSLATLTQFAAQTHQLPMTTGVK